MVSLWQIFWIFAKIGAFTIGGGIPMRKKVRNNSRYIMMFFVVIPTDEGGKYDDAYQYVYW